MEQSEITPSQETINLLTNEKKMVSYFSLQRSFKSEIYEAAEVEMFSYMNSFAFKI